MANEENNNAAVMVVWNWWWKDKSINVIHCIRHQMFIYSDNKGQKHEFVVSIILIHMHAHTHTCMLSFTLWVWHFQEPEIRMIFSKLNQKQLVFKSTNNSMFVGSWDVFGWGGKPNPLTNMAAITKTDVMVTENGLLLSYILFPGKSQLLNLNKCAQT